MLSFDAEAAKLKSLEESLWRDKTRFDRDYMEKILSKDFFEFGRSGRIYNRDECLSILPQEINAKLPLEGFKINIITEDIVLITYISEVRYEAVERANRCSLWKKENNQWRLCFHQGTPTQ